MSNPLTFPEMLDKLDEVAGKANALVVIAESLGRDVRVLAENGDPQEARDQASADLVARVMSDAHDTDNEIHTLIHQVLDGATDEEQYLHSRPVTADFPPPVVGDTTFRTPTGNIYDPRSGLFSDTGERLTSFGSRVSHDDGNVWAPPYGTAGFTKIGGKA